MSSINSVTLSGFLAADPEVKWSNDDGDSIVRLGLVVTQSKKNADGEYENVGSIFDCEVFGKFATLVAKKLRKKDSVTISGSLVKNEWENEDGQKRSRISVKVYQLDSQGMFRSADENNDLTAPAAPADNTPAPAGEPKSDDIPF